MNQSYRSFTSHQKPIGEFLERARAKDHEDVVYFRFPPSAGVFEDQRNRSMLFIDYTEDDPDKVSDISFTLQGEDGLIHDWVQMFQNEWGASVSREAS